MIEQSCSVTLYNTHIQAADKQNPAYRRHAVGIRSSPPHAAEGPASHSAPRFCRGVQEVHVCAVNRRFRRPRCLHVGYLRTDRRVAGGHDGIRRAADCRKLLARYLCPKFPSPPVIGRVLAAEHRAFNQSLDPQYALNLHRRRSWPRSRRRIGGRGQQNLAHCWRNHPQVQAPQATPGNRFASL